MPKFIAIDSHSVATDNDLNRSSTEWPAVIPQNHSMIPALTADVVRREFIEMGAEECTVTVLFWDVNIRTLVLGVKHNAATFNLAGFVRD